jgi:uncharacterized protein
MASDGKSDDDIRRILADTRSIAVVGASPNPDRPSHGVMAFLLERGYAVTPVNPGQAGGSILGAPAVGSLADLPGPVDMIDVFRNAAGAGATVDEVLALPWVPKVIWMQLGVVNPQAAAKAEAAGIEVVMDRCPKIEVARLGL